ncbi:MAG: hypothetical protein OEQ53_03990 [Saprospiraceae bacterium]|nr:hypothetical protein [Saprospiraceae bacterium]
MEKSQLIAKIFGALYLSLGTGYILSPEHYVTIYKSFMEGASLHILTWGIIPLVGGILMLHQHNIWDSTWRSFVTLWGWLCVVGGVIRIIFPYYLLNFGDLFQSADTMISFGVISITLGLFFGYYGFIHKIKPG